MIEAERSSSPQAVEALIGADTAEAFDGFTAGLGYDPKEVKQAVAGQYGGNGDVEANAAGRRGRQKMMVRSTVRWGTPAA